MAVGDRVEKRGHIVGFQEEIEKVSSDEDAFFNWFNDTGDKDSAFLRGMWDFALHIAEPVSRYVSKPEDKIALELGCGGGRILAAAAQSFKGAVGVDIHTELDKVKQELARRGINNIQLIMSNGIDIPVADSSVDVVYSFIVLQHVERIEVFRKYMQESSRVLRGGGIACLYFGRLSIRSLNSDSKIQNFIDTWIERTIRRSRYLEIPARVNCTNLRISSTLARKIAEENGFRVLDELISKKSVPDGAHLYGGQRGVVMEKI